MTAEKGSPNVSVDLQAAGFFVLRTPLLPIDEVLEWGAGLTSRQAWKAGDKALDSAWSADTCVLRTRLRTILERPEIIQALFVASPSLLAAVSEWKVDPDSKKGLQAERAIVRYFERMSARSTPFGLFSGCSVGRLKSSENEFSLQLSPREQYRLCTRLDFDYLIDLTRQLAAHPDLMIRLRYSANASLHKTADAWHYIESRVGSRRRTHHLVKVESTPYLDALILQAQKEAGVQELIDCIHAVPSADGVVSEEEAREYVFELIHSGILVSSLSPPVTGDSPLDDIIEQFAELAVRPRVLSVLRGVRDRLAELDETGIGTPVEEYHKVAKSLAQLPAALDLAKLYQVDMIKPAEAVLGGSVLEEMRRAAGILAQLGPVSEFEGLRKFREAFVSRYEGALVPLLAALDDETGIAYAPQASDPSPLIQGLALGRGENISGGQADLQTRILQKLTARSHTCQPDISLDVSELLHVDAPASVLPPSLMVMATLAARSAEAVKAGDFQLLIKWVYGPDGARLLGRFCQADSELSRLVRNYLAQEEENDPDAVCAEIVHLPEGRLGNVLCRPVLRKYEIPYLGRSGAAHDRQIPVNDLLVGVHQGHIFLYSKSLRKRVVPRMANAHTFSNPEFPAVYRFLCELQTQHGVGIPAFHWGALETAEMLPRLVAGRLVLSPAKWKLRAVESARLCAETGSRRFAAVQKLREDRGLPRWVLLKVTDNSLPVDLDNPLSVDAFVHVLGRKHEAILQELYPDPDKLGVRGPEGRFYHEIGLPFTCRIPNKRVLPDNAALAAAVVNAALPRSSRYYPPGSEWLYLKLYGGPLTIDEILFTRVKPLIDELNTRGQLFSWFFLRYSDPQNHLRLRFHGGSDFLQRDVFPLLMSTLNPLVMSGKIERISADTYTREIDRYGGIDAMPAAEEIFHIDSECVLDILSTTEPPDGESRWKLALLGADALLSDFGFDLAGKFAMMARLRGSFYQEFQMSATLKKQLGSRYRAARPDIDSLFASSTFRAGTPLPEKETAVSAFGRRSSRLRPVITRLSSLLGQGRATRTLPQLVESFVHMHINRLISSAPRAHELVIYDFLSRIYEGRQAREKVSRDTLVSSYQD